MVTIALIAYAGRTGLAVSGLSRVISGTWSKRSDGRFGMLKRRPTEPALIVYQPRLRCEQRLQRTKKRVPERVPISGFTHKFYIFQMPTM